MDAPLATSGDAADQPTDGRTQREGSYHPMASDTDSGAISDGDPPGYSGGTPPPPLLAPPPALPNQQQDRSETASASESVAGGSASGTPTTNGTGTGKSKTAFKRAFEELEDIVFSNPKSFVTMASTIAESRGVQVLISDDRTHKVSSAYMHMICVYRKSGCPFILKLTKSKEGGWITKSARAIEIDPKQRSVYRCRHVATAHPDYRLGITPADWIAMARPDGTSGQFVPSAKAKSKTRVSLGGIKYEDGEASSSPAPIKPPGRMATRNKPASTPASPSGAGRTGTGGGMDVDRALAPPFQRAIDLQAQIAPALAPPAGAITGVPPPPGRPGASPSTSNVFYSRNATASPRHPAASTSGPSRGLVLPLYDTAPSASVAPQYSNPPSNALGYPRAGGSSGVSPIPRHAALHPASPNIPVAATPPCVATADPSALSDWTALLTALDDPELLPLARVLASPAIAATPTSFFADEIDDELRDKLLESLPAQATGLWPKLKLARRMKERGRECWERIVEDRGGAKGGKNKRPAANGDADEAARKRKRSASPLAMVTNAADFSPAPAQATNGTGSPVVGLDVAATPSTSADVAKLSLSPPNAANTTHASPLSLTPSLPPVSTPAAAASPPKEPNGAVTMRMAWSPSAGHTQEVVAPASSEAPKSAAV